jgi:hypothetical protein
VRAFTGKAQKWARKICKPQIRKFLGSFRNQKSAKLRGVPVQKSQIHKFVIINPQIANPQICKRKSNVSDPDPHLFASNIFSTYMQGTNKSVSEFLFAFLSLIGSTYL